MQTKYKKAMTEAEMMVKVCKRVASIEAERRDLAVAAAQLADAELDYAQKKLWAIEEALELSELRCEDPDYIPQEEDL
jgi:hypothetical protein